MTCELTVQDYQGRTITLDHTNWQKHLPRHPEVAPYHAALPTVLADPDLVMEMADGAWHYYRGGLLAGRHARCYLKVVVESSGAAGWKLKTAYIASATKPMGTIRCIRQRR
jgi:hypothetical protein